MIDSYLTIIERSRVGIILLENIFMEGKGVI